MLFWFTLSFALIALPVDSGDETYESKLAKMQSEYAGFEKSAAKLAQEVRSLSTSGATDTESKRSQLRAAVQSAFEMRGKIQSLQLEQAEENVRVAKERLVRRNELASSIVARRVNELLGSDDLAWLSADETVFGGLVETSQPPELINGQDDEFKLKGFVPSTTPSLLGFTVEPMKREEIRKLNERMKTKYTGALRIEHVVAGSIAQKAGLLPGDILLGVGGWRTASLLEINAIYNNEQLRTHDRWKFYCVRGEQTFRGDLDMSKQLLQEAQSRSSIAK